MSPVFIPSKGRPYSVKTIKHFNDTPVVVVVEPGQKKAYEDGGHKNLLVLPENDQGIAYVRNFILSYAQKKGLEKYWMLDDDITAFKKYTGNLPVSLTGEEALAEAEMLLSEVPNLGQGALEYNQFAWAGKNEISIMGYCDVAVLVFAKRVGEIRYRSEMNLKEDRDFTLQVLAHGMATARACKIGFAAPKNGSNQGGLFDEYNTYGREREASDRMIKAWPNVCTLNIKPDGRPDLTIRWKKAYCMISNAKR